MLTDIKKLEH